MKIHHPNSNYGYGSLVNKAHISGKKCQMTNGKYLHRAFEVTSEWRGEKRKLLKTLKLF